jgi:hypothetical protein
MVIFHSYVSLPEGIPPLGDVHLRFLQHQLQLQRAPHAPRRRVQRGRAAVYGSSDGRGNCGALPDSGWIFHW